MTPCYDSTMVADNEAFVALPSTNNALRLVFSRKACNDILRPTSAMIGTLEKAAIDESVLKAVGFP